MRRLLLSAAALLSIVLSGQPASAQKHPTVPAEGNVKIIFNYGEPDQMVYDAFIENAPTQFNEPGVPRFAIKGNDDSFYLGIGGYIKGVGLYDWGSPIDNPNDFTTADIPFNTADGNGGKLQSSFGQSRIFINFVALPGNKNKVGAYIGGKFKGEHNTFVLNHVYITYRGFTVGHTASLFEDGAATPPTIDSEGPCGLAGITKDLINYAYDFSPRFRAAIGVEFPSASITTDASTGSVNQRIPDIPAYVQYGWDGGRSWLRLSALMRNTMYRDLVKDRNHTVTGWGVKLSGSALAGTSPLRFYYQMAYGRGIGGYIQDFAGLGLDLYPSHNKPGKLANVEAWGGYLGAQYTFSPKLYATLTYSQSRAYPDKTSAETSTGVWDAQYSYAQYVCGNVFYTIVPGLQCGIEYLYGRRVDLDGLSRHDNRINAMLQFNF